MFPVKMSELIVPDTRFQVKMNELIVPDTRFQVKMNELIGPDTGFQVKINEKEWPKTLFFLSGFYFFKVGFQARPATVVTVLRKVTIYNEQFSNRHPP